MPQGEASRSTSNSLVTPLASCPRRRDMHLRSEPLRDPPLVLREVPIGGNQTLGIPLRAKSPDRRGTPDISRSAAAGMMPGRGLAPLAGQLMTVALFVPLVPPPVSFSGCRRKISACRLRGDGLPAREQDRQAVAVLRSFEQREVPRPPPCTSSISS